MLERKDCVTGTIVVYVFLIMLFLLFQEKHKIENPCEYNQPCVRFCCEDKSACKEKYIRESFNESLLHRYTYDEETNETSEFFILNGKPKCSMMLIPANDTSHVWRFIYHGNILLDDKILVDTENYCFQESKDNETLNWDLMVCKTNYYLQRKLHILFSAVSIIFLSAIIFVYASVHALRSTISGKCLLIFMSSYTLLMIGLLLAHFRLVMDLTMCAVFAGFFFSFIWLAILVFDNWFSLRNFQVTTDDAKRFKFYYQFALAFLFIILFIILILGNFHALAARFAGFFVGSFFTILSITSLSEVVFIIFSGIKIFELSKNNNFSENLKLAEEKERFWNVLMVYAIMHISWPIELIGWDLDDSSAESMIVSDFIKCFSSIVLFFIFVMKENVRVLLFDRYGSLKNHHEAL